MNPASTVQIRFIKLSRKEEDNCVIETLTGSLPAQLQTVIARKKFRRHRVSKAAGWLLLKFQLLQAGYDTNVLASLQKSSFGKPYLPGPCNFSISYSGNYAICALASVKRLGIDIELISDINIYDLDRYFSDTEWSIIVNCKDPKACFFQFWTRKESVLKADGRGLYVDPGDVSVDENVGRIRDSATKYYLTNLLGIGDNIATTLCTDQPETFPAVERVEISHLRSLESGR